VDQTRQLKVGWQSGKSVAINSGTSKRSRSEGGRSALDPLLLLISLGLRSDNRGGVAEHHGVIGKPQPCLRHAEE
jgi:hypothetical protein